MTNFCAEKISESMSLLATTRSMVAPGAIAWAHSTSRLISPVQFTWSALVGSNGVGRPAR